MKYSNCDSIFNSLFLCRSYPFSTFGTSKILFTDCYRLKLILAFMFSRTGTSMYQLAFNINWFCWIFLSLSFLFFSLFFRFLFLLSGMSGLSLVRTTCTDCCVPLGIYYHFFAIAPIWYTIVRLFTFYQIKIVCPQHKQHVLIIPRRVVKRFPDLTDDEICDLWTTARLVGSRLEKYHNATSLTLNIQVSFSFN